ncbi:hypothetical protein PR003_g20918 [Phytophthora rubi]|uniref:Uncharacterized protein n=1 Tax=Phytophthora rubi TaxID=129364 RepID=A0A6A3JGF8_9STRA|nr:hypothetical protein PR001_g29035 [Phytophthora rubi]KAE8993232.1 hypothetical protein PR002_g20299 [Phytophthora rubi]KAE9307765.1 hypothetical protein PR003_g20918 [Phytophthora rubi]
MPRKPMRQKRASTLVPSWDSSKETTVPRQKMKAPDLEDDEEKGSEPRWSEAALESEVQIAEAEVGSYRPNRQRDSNRRIDRQTGVILPSRDEQVSDETAASIDQKDTPSGDSECRIAGCRDGIHRVS